MNDERSLQEIVAEHPVPWRPMTIPGIQHGMARIVLVDGRNAEVPLFTILRVTQLVTDKLATQA